MGVIWIIIAVIILSIIIAYATRNRSESGYKNGWVPLIYGYTLPSGLTEDERKALEEKYDEKAKRWFQKPENLK